MNPKKKAPVAQQLIDSLLDELPLLSKMKSGKGAVVSGSSKGSISKGPRELVFTPGETSGGEVILEDGQHIMINDEKSKSIVQKIAPALPPIPSVKTKPSRHLNDKLSNDLKIENEMDQSVVFSGDLGGEGTATMLRLAGSRDPAPADPHQAREAANDKTVSNVIDITSSSKSHSQPSSKSNSLHVHSLKDLEENLGPGVDLLVESVELTSPAYRARVLPKSESKPRSEITEARQDVFDNSSITGGEGDSNHREDHSPHHREAKSPHHREAKSPHHREAKSSTASEIKMSRVQNQEIDLDGDADLELSLVLESQANMARVNVEQRRGLPTIPKIRNHQNSPADHREISIASDELLSELVSDSLPESRLEVSPEALLAETSANHVAAGGIDRQDPVDHLEQILSEKAAQKGGPANARAIAEGKGFADQRANAEAKGVAGQRAVSDPKGVAGRDANKKAKSSASKDLLVKDLLGFEGGKAALGNLLSKVRGVAGPQRLEKQKGQWSLLPNAKTPPVAKVAKSVNEVARPKLPKFEVPAAVRSAAIEDEGHQTSGAAHPGSHTASIVNVDSSDPSSFEDEQTMPLAAADVRSPVNDAVSMGWIQQGEISQGQSGSQADSNQHVVDGMDSAELPTQMIAAPAPAQNYGQAGAHEQKNSRPSVEPAPASVKSLKQGALDSFDRMMQTEIRPGAARAREQQEQFANQGKENPLSMMGQKPAGNYGIPSFHSAEASLKQSESLRIAQSRISDLEHELERLRRENEKLGSAGETLRRHSDELRARAENAEQEKRESERIRDEERKVMRGQMSQKDRDNNETRQRLEEAEGRLESNFKKIRVRERELEHRLEIMKMESATLVSTKDKMILDLKRQMDQLIHENEYGKQKAQEAFNQYKGKQETIRRVVRALRIALTILEGDDENVVPSKKAE